MATGTKAPDINAEALELIEGAIHERLQELIPDLVRYVNASQEPGKVSLAIALTPDKKTEGAFWVSVTPKLTATGIISEGPATLEVVGNEIQLKLAGIESR